MAIACTMIFIFHLTGHYEIPWLASFGDLNTENRMKKKLKPKLGRENEPGQNVGKYLYCGSQTMPDWSTSSYLIAGDPVRNFLDPPLVKNAIC